MLNYLTALRSNGGAFVPGVALAWTLFVGNDNTRWSSGPPCVAPTAATREPPVPWCGLLWPDGTPVSYTEAAATRHYLSGSKSAVSECLLFDDFLSLSSTLAGDMFLNLSKFSVEYLKRIEKVPAGGAMMVETSLWLGTANSTAALEIISGATAGESTAAELWRLQVNVSGLYVRRVVGGATVASASLPAFALPSGVVPSAWNILRVLVTPAGGSESLSVFLNPTAHPTVPSLGRVTACLNISSPGSASPERAVRLPAPSGAGFVGFDYISVLPLDGGVKRLKSDDVAARPKPHLLLLLIDDLGWANVGFHRAQQTREVQTPVIDGLVKDGIELTRHYVYSSCSPARSALISGRLPVHVNALLQDPTIHNPADTESGWQGIPRSMTGIASVLKKAGYKAHAVGKWDVGMGTPQHTPEGRGFDSSLVYFHHANDYFTREEAACAVNSSTDPESKPKKAKIVDLWDSGAPAVAVNASAGAKYEEDIFKERAISIIEKHPASAPLFMYYASHIVHQPYEVPDSYNTTFSFIQDEDRRVYHAMVNCLDDVLGDIVTSWKAKLDWSNTLIFASTDNGGPIQFGANNYPLRGGKYSDWEGGVRGTAFIAGGIVPTSLRGSTSSAITHLCDVYTSFAALAGVADVTDKPAAKAKLPPVDGVDVLSYVLGKNKTVPRTEIYGDGLNDQWPGFLISSDFKLLRGIAPFATWTSATSPNTTGCDPRTCSKWPQVFKNWNCSSCVPPVSMGKINCTAFGGGCLYNVAEDPAEHHELSASQPALKQKLIARYKELLLTAFAPERGTIDPAACKQALLNKQFWGPFRFLNSTSERNANSKPLKSDDKAGMDVGMGAVQAIAALGSRPPC